MFKYTRTAFLIGFLILCPTLSMLVSAQPGPPPGGPPPCWPPPCAIPLDGGLSFLLAAGAAYAGKKLIDSKKES